MATTQNNASLELGVINNTSFNLVNDKDKKKQNELLMNLQASLLTLGEVLEHASGGMHSTMGAEEGSCGATQTNESTDEVTASTEVDSTEATTAPENDQLSMTDAIGEMLRAMQDLQTTIAQNAEANTERSAEMSDLQKEQLEKNMVDFAAAVAKAAAAAAKAKKWGFWGKVIQIAVAVVAVVAGALTMGAGAAAIMAISTIVMTSLSMSGEMDKLVTGLASALGCSELVASILITIFVTLLTVGACFAVTAEVAAETVGEEVVDEAVNEGVNEGADSIASQVKDNLIKLVKFICTPATKAFEGIASLGKWNLVILNLIQTIGETNVANHSVEQYAKDHGLSDKEKEKIEEILGYVMMGVDLFVGAAAFTGVSQACSKITKEAEVVAERAGEEIIEEAETMVQKATKMAKALGQKMITNMKDPAYRQSALNGLLTSLALTQTLVGVELGVATIAQGDAEEDTASISADMQLGMTAMDMAGDYSQQVQKQATDKESQPDLDISQVWAGEDKIAQIMTEFA